MSAKTDLVVPATMLEGLINRRVAVKLKWGQLYVGDLKSIDSRMNILLSGCNEHQKTGDEPSELGDVLVRCNNVLYVRDVSAKGEVPALFAK